MKNLALTISIVALATSAIAEPVTYTVDPSHTFVIYEISHFGTSTNRGRFPIKEGNVQLDRSSKSGQADITIDIAPSTGVPALDKHLSAKDFFDTAEFSTGKFSARKFIFDGDKPVELGGTLTLLGKTNPVTLKGVNFNCYQNPMLKREVCGGDFEATLTRSQWGINWGLNYGFPDNVHVIVQVEAIRQ